LDQGNPPLYFSKFMTYYVREPFIAVRDEPPAPFAFTTITPGSTIKVLGEVQPSGLVDVLHDGKIVAAFMRDIEARAERIKTESA
jgi:hypothetical protein